MSEKYVCIMKTRVLEYDFPRWSITHGKCYDADFITVRMKNELITMVCITDDRGRMSRWSKAGFEEKFIKLEEWTALEREKKLNNLGL